MLNALWTPVFFGAHQVGVALLTISALLVPVAVLVARFLSLSPLAGWLTVPYLVWLAFATVLKAAIWWLS